MPYRRRTTYRSSYRPQQKKMLTNQQPTRFDTYAKAGKQLFNDVLYLKSMINSEMRLKTAHGDFATSDTGNMVHTSDIAQGTQVDQRAGESVLPRGLEMKMIIEKNTAASVATEQVRIICFRWFAKTIPTVQEILEDVSTLSPYERVTQGAHSDVGLFDILCDQTFILSNTWQPIQQFHMNCPINDPRRPTEHIHFNNTDTTSEVGAIYWFALTNQPVNTCHLTYYTRLHWHNN